jgi:predicted RNA-binding protein with PUA-like domain
MAYWLLKSEPETWSWAEQKKRGARGEPWSGVRNFEAAANMKAMRKGDLGFFYHSGLERRILGIVEVIRLYHEDLTDPSCRFGAVTVKAVRDLPHPVTLADIRAHPQLTGMELVRKSRLSVQKVEPEAWRIVCRMGGQE